MRKLLITLICILLSTSALSRGGTVSVRGYHRHDGTYVQPHHRTAPDGTVTNNWSYAGNVNPYTGKVGTNYNSKSSPTCCANATMINSQPNSIHYYEMNQHGIHNTQTAADYLK